MLLRAINLRNNDQFDRAVKAALQLATGEFEQLEFTTDTRLDHMYLSWSSSGKIQKPPKTRATASARVRVCRIVYVALLRKRR